VQISYIRVGESPDVKPPSRKGAWVVDSADFRRLVEMEIQKAQRLRYSLALLCVTANGRTREAQEPAGSSVLERITELLRTTDAVAHWASSSIALMLVDAEVMNIPSIFDRLTTKLEMFHWSAGGACYPRTTAHPEALLHHALDLMIQAERDGGNRLYLPA
jgi:hypothetical protein